MSKSDPNRRYSVLFVDDEPRITTALKAIFRREYNVHVANSGAEALQLLRDTDVDVIVSDQRMPEMLGNEFLAKASKSFPRSMRVLLTGFTDREAIIDSINEGEIYRFINKPWRNDELKEIIADAALASEIPLEQANVSSNSAETFPDHRASDDKTKSQRIADKAVLMMEHSQQIRNQLRRLARDQKMMIYGTQNIEQAVVAATTRKAIGVAVVELSNNPTPAIEAIHALKRIRPDVITIALAKEYDAQIAIDLINQGQVYKYLSTPIDEASMAKIIHKAFSRHTVLKANKGASLRYKVDTRRGRVVSGLQEMLGRVMKSVNLPESEIA